MNLEEETRKAFQTIVGKVEDNQGRYSPTTREYALYLLAQTDAPDIWANLREKVNFSSRGYAGEFVKRIAPTPT